MPSTDFVPPRCPNRQCRAHRDQRHFAYKHVGWYRTQSRSEPVPRFRCLRCGRGFSRQTFRIDYRDKAPQKNVPLYQLLISGVGLRQAARMLDMGVSATQRKFRKLAQHMRFLNRNLVPKLPGGRTFLLDEAESYEHRNIAPLTLPVMVERDSKFVVANDVAPIRRMAKKGSERQRRLERHEAKHGKRQDRGSNSVRKVFGRFERLLAGQSATLLTDEKAAYATQCRRRFGTRVEHRTTSSRAARTPWNPLFAINLTEAMLRDNNGRLRRRTWLVSKKRYYLRLQVELFASYRNWHRPRHNDDQPDDTPGVLLKLCPRQLQLHELLAWRQDWRQRSIHPAYASGREATQQDVGRN